MTSKAFGLIVLIALATLGCNTEKPAPAAAKTAAAPPPWTLKVEPLETPAAAGSSGPQLTVSERGPLVSWVEQNDEKTTLKFAERTALGWSEPRVAASGTDWFVTDADTPAVIRLSNGALVASWLQSSSDEFEA